MMAPAARFLGRPRWVVTLIVVAIWPFGGCNSPGAKVPDAAGVDAAPDVAANDIGGASDGAPADVASDSGARDVAGSDGGGADGTDSGADPCHPPCRARIYGGCAPEGACVYTAGTFCFSNGVITYTSAPGGTTRQTLTKNGVVCATLDATNVWRDPSGAPLGTVVVYADGSTGYNCTGEAPVMVPPSCTIPCTAGMCPP